MKNGNIEVVHYNRNRDKIDITSAQNQKNIKEIVVRIIDKSLFGGLN